MKKLLLLLMSLLATCAASAGDKPVYSLVSPGATTLYVRSKDSAQVDPQLKEWSEQNANVVASSAQYDLGTLKTPPTPDRSKDPSASVYRRRRLSPALPRSAISRFIISATS